MCGKWFVAMSRTKARTISSLRMRRCNQRRNKTNCTSTGTKTLRKLEEKRCTCRRPKTNDQVRRKESGRKNPLKGQSELSRGTVIEQITVLQNVPPYKNQ